MSNVIRLPFSALALRTEFTFSRFPSIIYEKIASDQARPVGCPDPSMIFVDLDDADSVYPVWLETITIQDVS